MSPARRRLLHAASFELFGIALVGTGLALMSGEGLAGSGLFAAVSSLVAMGWNTAFNWGFESWERHQPVRGRPLARRIVHAVGFEAGLTLLLVPLLAWWIGVGLVEAFLYDIALVAVFVAYAFLFNLAFDRLFGLPASAR
jgi:uncharacterized membrane protein